MTTSNCSTDEIMSTENMHCFVCDTIVTGKYYPLATVRAQNSRIRLIEKLGALVGDQYMVVISEDDVICRGCATYMNSLDRLETEALSIRSIVLKFLEKKYSLTEGELVNQTNTGLSQPPRIIHSDTSDERIEPREVSYKENFMAKKRKAAIAAMNKPNVDNQENSIQYKNNPRDQWMQCGTCKYTTSVDSFMRHHLRDSPEGKNDPKLIKKDDLNKKSLQMKKSGTLPKKAVKKAPAKRKSKASTSECLDDSIGPETVELSDGSNTITSIMDNNDVNAEPMDAETINIQIVRQGQSRKTYYGSKKKGVTIVLPEIPADAVNLDVGEVITADPEHIGMNDELMKISQDVEEDTVYVDMEECGDQSKITKQVLTLGEDGSVEVVEVMWDEMSTAAINNINQDTLEY